MSDTIMQWTDLIPTAIATFLFAATVLPGAWLAARYGAVTLLPALVVAGITFYVRAQCAPLEIVAITSMSVLHVCAGVILGVLLKKSFGQRPATT